jgi:glyoxylase-like metal-dependent hydrolase (beta-lactamase superfamily II)
MEKVPLSDYEVAPLDDVADHVVGLRIVFVNVFAITTPTGWTLIDAGLPFSAGRIRSWAERQFGEHARPQSIVLTHGHFDHTGAIEDLLKTWDVPVYAHRLEMPYLTGEKKYPPPDPSAGGGLMSFLSPLYPRGPVDIRDHVRPFPDDGAVPGMPGWQCIFTPGHTAGHCSFFRPEDRTLLVGDAFCTTDQQSFLAVARQKPELHGPPAYYTPDWTNARRSVEKLAALEPRILAPGHGLPMSGGAIPSQLATLAANFDEIAIPSHSHHAQSQNL